MPPYWTVGIPTAAIHSTFKIPMRKRYQGVILDLLLIAWAALVPFHPVEDWLLRHKHWVYWAMGSLHLLALPWLMMWMIAMPEEPKDPAQPRVFGPERGPLDEFHSFSFVLFFGCSWLIPVCLGFAQRVGNQFSYYLFLFGPFLLFSVVGTALFQMEKWRKPDPMRLNVAPGPRAVQATLLFIAAYLSITETSLYCIRVGKRILSNTDDNLGLCMALALVSYVPTRLALFRFQATSRIEFVPLVLALVHLLYRLAVAS